MLANKTAVVLLLALLLTLSVVLFNGVAAKQPQTRSFSSSGLETEYADIEKEMEDVQVLRHRRRQPRLTLKRPTRLQVIPNEDEGKSEYSSIPVHSKYVHLPQFVDTTVTKLQDLLNEKLRTEDEKEALKLLRKELRSKKSQKKASQVIAEVASERLGRAKEAKKIVRTAALTAFFGRKKQEKKVEPKKQEQKVTKKLLKPLLRIIIQKRKDAKNLVQKNKQAAKIIETLKRATEKKKSDKTGESIRKIIHKVVSGKIYASHFPEEYKVAQKNLKVLIRTLIRYTKSQPSKVQGCLSTLLRNLRFIRHNLRRIDSTADKELEEYYAATLKRSKEVSSNFNDAIVKVKPILDAARNSLKNPAKCGKPKAVLPKKTVVVRVAKKNVKKCEEKKQQKLNLFRLIRLMKKLRQKKEKARKGCKRVKSSIGNLSKELSKNVATVPLVKPLEKLKKATWNRPAFIKLLKALLRHAEKISEPTQKQLCLDGLLKIKKEANSVKKFLPQTKSVKNINKARKSVNKLVKQLVKAEGKLTPAQQVQLCGTIKQLKKVNKQLKKVNPKPIAKLVKLIKKQVAKVAPQNAAIQAQLEKVQKRVKTAQKTLKKDAKKSATLLSKKISNLVKSVTSATTKVTDSKVQQRLNKVAVRLQKIQPKTNAMKPKEMKKAIASLKKVETKLQSPALDKAVKSIAKRVRLIAQSAPSKLQIKVNKTKQSVSSAISQLKNVSKESSADTKKTVSKLIQSLRTVRGRCGTVPRRSLTKALQTAKQTASKIQLPAPVAQQVKSALKQVNKVEKRIVKVADKKQEKAKVLINKLVQNVKASPKAAGALKSLTKLQSKVGKKVSPTLLNKVKTAVIKAAPAQKSLVNKLVRVEKNLNKRIPTPKSPAAKKVAKSSSKLTKALKSQIAKGTVNKVEVKPIVKELKLVARAASRGCIHTAKRLTIDLRRKIASLNSTKLQKIAIKLQTRVTKVIIARETKRAKVRVSKLIRMFKRASTLSNEKGKAISAKTIKLLRVFKRYAKTADCSEVSRVLAKVVKNARKVDSSMIPRVTRISARIRVFLSHKLSLKLSSAQIVFKQKVSNLMSSLRFVHGKKAPKATVVELLNLLFRLKLSAGRSKKDVNVVTRVQNLVRTNVPTLGRPCNDLVQRLMQMRRSKLRLPSIPLGKKALRKKFIQLRIFALNFVKQLRKVTLADKRARKQVRRVRRLVRLLVKTASKPHTKYDRVLARLYKRASSCDQIRKQALAFLDVFSSHVSLLRAFLPTRKVRQMPLAVLDARRKIKIAILKLRLVRRVLQGRRQRRAMRKILRGLYRLRVRVRRGTKFTRLANRLLANVNKLDAQIRTEVGDIVAALLQQAARARKSLPKRRVSKRSKAVKVLIHALRLQRRSLSRGDEKRAVLLRIIRLLRKVKKSSRCQERNKRILSKVRRVASVLSGDDAKSFRSALSNVRAEVLGQKKKRSAKKVAPKTEFKNPLQGALDFILSNASNQKKPAKKPANKPANRAHKWVDFSFLRNEIKQLL